ncbi:tRNA uridine-5-carboxymethylaminomethyl(34) synthesis GTPase MnmE [Rhodothermus sp. AH-315-K08]|nr:tRNA uridine-5-carboxymethylaminomethyl(34) synthesis GTPase MnmE [Rhodothermus sp. AH-315-K08]
MSDSTIAAIATARGEAALSIVRMSGPKAISIAAEVYSGSADDLNLVPSHTVWFGIVSDREGRPIDQVVTTVFRGPRSSTGEDVVEFCCHGGAVAPAEVLRALLDHGAEAAKAGEFTQRAFVNGKLGLDQAEAVMDLIHSRSVAAQRVSLRQLQGRLKAQLGSFRSDLLELCGLVELELDFIEEDVEFADRSQIAGLLEGLESLVMRLLASAEYTDTLRDGLSVVIAGRPNAGKSTLLNALVGSERVIVSETPGTTRDFVDAEMTLSGLPVRLTDTAGLREATEEIEREGVLRAKKRIAEADVLIYVFDSTQGLDADEEQYLSALADDQPTLVVVLAANKADLYPQSAVKAGISLSAKNALSDPAVLEALLEEIVRRLPPALLDHEASPGMINARHVGHLRSAADSLSSARRCLDQKLGGELFAVDLRGALDSIGAITGDITNEDVLAEIFGRFCIGK